MRKIEKELYIEILRIVAVLFVIFNHTDGYFLYYCNTENPLTWWFSFLGSVLCRSNVPLFVMITGTLLLDKTESMYSLFKKRVLKIGSVLFSFSFFYYVLDVYRDKTINFSILEFLRGLLKGSIQDSFWYLYLYLGLLLLLPLLRKMAVSCSNAELKYFLCLQFIFETSGGIFSFLTGIEINSYLYIVNDYVFYLLSGYYLGRRIKVERIDKKSMIASSGMIFLCIVGTFFFVKLDWRRTGTYHQAILDLLAAVLAINIFLCVRYIFWKYSIPKKVKGIIYEAGKCVFGIYLLEQFARIQLMPFYLYLSQNTFGIFACSCYIIASFSLAWFYTEVLKRVPGVKRLL